MTIKSLHSAIEVCSLVYHLKPLDQSVSQIVRVHHHEEKNANLIQQNMYYTSLLIPAGSHEEGIDTSRPPNAETFTADIGPFRDKIRLKPPVCTLAILFANANLYFPF